MPGSPVAGASAAVPEDGGGAVMHGTAARPARAPNPTAGRGACGIPRYGIAHCAWYVTCWTMVPP